MYLIMEKLFPLAGHWPSAFNVPVTVKVLFILIAGMLNACARTCLNMKHLRSLNGASALRVCTCILSPLTTSVRAVLLLRKPNLHALILTRVHAQSCFSQGLTSPPLFLCFSQLIFLYFCSFCCFAPARSLFVAIFLCLLSFFAFVFAI